jgi:hypothetical protein
MNNSIQIVLAAVDQLSGPLDRARLALGNFGGAADKISRSLNMLGISSGLSAAALASWVKSGIDAADAMNDLSERTGIAVSTLAGLQYAAKLSDTSLESIAKGVNKLAIYIGDANRGNDKYRETLNAIGITARDPEKALVQLADVFPKLTDQNQRASVMTDLLGKSWQELVPLLNKGGDALRQQISIGQQLNPITAEMAERAARFNDQLDTTIFRLDGLKMKIANEVLPVLNDMMRDIDLGIKHFGSLGNALINLGLSNPFKTAREHVSDLKASIAELTEQIVKIDAKRASPGYLEKKLGELATLRAKLAYYEEQIEPEKKDTAAKKIGDGTYKLPDIVVKAKAPEFTDVFTGEAFDKAMRARAAAGKRSGFSHITSDKDFAKQVRESQDFINQANAEQAENLKKLQEDISKGLQEKGIEPRMDIYSRANEATEAFLKPLREQIYDMAGTEGFDGLLLSFNALSKAAYAYGDARAAIESMDKVASDRQSALSVVQSEVTAGVLNETDARNRGLAINRAALEGMSEHYEKLQALAQTGYPPAIEAMNKYKSVMIDLKDQARDKTWIDGIQQGLKDYAGQFNDTFNNMRSATQRAFKSMEDAMVNFVMTGKLNFKSLSNSIIADLVRIQIQQSITKPLSQAMSGINLASLWPFAQGGAPGGVSAWRNQVVDKPTLFAFANGGIMGEAGPEAIMPLRRDSQGRLGVSAEGRTAPVVNVTQHITIDSRSDKASIVAAIIAAKEQAKVEIMDSMRRGGAFARA